MKSQKNLHSRLHFLSNKLKKSGQLNLSLSLSLSHFFALVWAEKAAAAVVHLRLVFAN